MIDSTVTKSVATGWIMVLISSTACIIGASIVFVDSVWRKRQRSVLSNKAFLASSMALASGVLLVSSLAILLPESQIRLKSTPKAYGWFLAGATITLILTRVIHWCTPEAIHACGSDSSSKPHHHHHDGSLSTSSSSSSSSSSPTMVPQQHEHTSSTEESQQPSHLVEHRHRQRHQQHQHHQHHQHQHQNDQSNVPPPSEERRKLISSQNASTMDYGSTVLPNAHFRFHEHTHHNMSHDVEEQQLPPLQPHLDDNHKSHHHLHNHHGHSGSSINSQQDDGELDLGQDKQQFWRIGIQTAIAICIHKFPEGLIMFISSQASSSLGVSVAAAMSIHNLTEGFMMALPIYYALGSRSKAFLCASLMGGLSQPLGALIGLLAFKSVTKEQEDLLFGITFGIISGMMSFITIQSMLPQAIKVDIESNQVVIFFFLGVFLVGLTTLLKSI